MKVLEVEGVEVDMEGVTSVNNFLTITVRHRFGPSFPNLCGDDAGNGENDGVVGKLLTAHLVVLKFRLYLAFLH